LTITYELYVISVANRSLQDLENVGSSLSSLQDLQQNVTTTLNIVNANIQSKCADLSLPTCPNNLTFAGDFSQVSLCCIHLYLTQSFVS